MLRAGGAGSNTAADHIEASRLALAQLPRHLRRKVLIRADSGGGTHGFLHWLTAKSSRLHYSVGMTVTEDMQNAILKVPADSWTPAYDGGGQVRDGAWVADITGMLDLSSWPAGMRVIVRKERPHPGAQLRFTDIDGHRFTAFATDAKKGQLADLELLHRRRARCEDRILLRGSALAPMVTVSRLRSSEADDGTLSGATGVVQGRHAACQLRRAVALSWLMSSRLAARAAARSWSRSSSWRRRSMACCSRCASLWLRASMSAGAPSPDSCHACSPSASDRRRSSCWTRAARRRVRSCAASRSACSDALVTAGPVPLVAAALSRGRGLARAGRGGGRGRCGPLRLRGRYRRR